ncbi:hypothetical protein AAY24_11580 [Sedimenticola thiotaurini]|uniref:Uncharacterized protein n=1 Tax=Sedimenticola thiotaurini TaxID=1543721 RepID=A0A0F7K123_9GAMM|nr:hypothetical protein AAY24_11580 [Sedimenticola thiotaurini]
MRLLNVDFVTKLKPCLIDCYGALCKKNSSLYAWLMLTHYIYFYALTLCLWVGFVYLSRFDKRQIYIYFFLKLIKVIIIPFQVI